MIVIAMVRWALMEFRGRRVEKVVDFVAIVLRAIGDVIRRSFVSFGNSLRGGVYCGVTKF
jgi:hypothetical protein